MVLGFYKRKNTSSGKMIASRLHAGELDVFGKLREYQLLVLSGRGEGARLADALVRGLLFRVHQIDRRAVELVPYLLVRLGQGRVDPGLIAPGERKRSRHAVLDQVRGGLRADAPDLLDRNGGEEAVRLA